MDAAPEIVFSHFTDPSRMTKWLGESATLDPRPGGALRVEFDPEHTAVGSFTEVEPPTRVVFTWGYEQEANGVPPGSSTVTVTLEADGDGTLLRLEHSDLPAAEREAHDRGWEHFLGQLAQALKD
jgi:uncharacterized protein YndB with AHSA1/START domain